MFGLTLTKLLFTVLVIVVVWRGFALIGKLQRTRQARAVARERARAGRRVGTIELVECKRCGAYFDPRDGCRCTVTGAEGSQSGRP